MNYFICLVFVVNLAGPNGDSTYKLTHYDLACYHRDDDQNLILGTYYFCIKVCVLGVNYF